MDTIEMMQKLEKYGVNMKEVSRRFCGDFILYEKCLRGLYDPVNYLQLKSAIEAGEYDRAFVTAHTLKGLSGNLGLTPFYQAICTLVETLRSKDYNSVEDDYCKMNCRLEELKELLPEKEFFI